LTRFAFFLVFGCIPAISESAMKQSIFRLAIVSLLIGATPLPAQLGGGGMSGSPTGPSLSGEMLKLLGEHKGFSAKLEFQVRPGGKGSPTTMPGKIFFADGKSRFEMDLSQAKGDQIPPQALEQLKEMSMDKLTMISLPKKDQSYLVYPGLECYVKLPVSDPDAKNAGTDLEMDVTRLGEEDMGGYPCIKNKVVVTDREGKQHESTVWNAVALKEFPVKIQTTEEGHEVTLLFTDVKLSRPGDDLFAPPAAYAAYDNMMGMMQAIMMKRMGAGAPPAK
jgi:hypothetical protein